MFVMECLVRGMCLLKYVLDLVLDIGQVLHKGISFVLLLLFVGCGLSLERNCNLIRSKRLKIITDLKWGRLCGDISCPVVAVLENEQVMIHCLLCWW